MRKATNYKLETETSVAAELVDNVLSIEIEPASEYDLPVIRFQNPAMFRAFVKELTEILEDWDKSVS